jgi:hypothetical protein
MAAMNSLHTAISTLITLATFGRQEAVSQGSRGVDSLTTEQVSDSICGSLPRRFDGRAEVLHSAISTLVGPATFRFTQASPER